MDINDQKKALCDIIEKIIGFTHLEYQIECKEEENAAGRLLSASVYTPDNTRFLIGKDGQNLKALEHLVRIIFAKNNADSPCQIAVDVNDYRRSRSQHAIELAKQAVGRVRMSQKAEALDPMTSYERRIVHMELASCPDITTESIGDEPQRRVVIKPFP